MSSYFGYFFNDTGQAIALITVSLIWLSFCVIGAAFGPRQGIGEANPLVGWALISYLFLFGGVFFNLPFTLIAITVGLITLIGLVRLRHKNISVLPLSAGRILILGLPLFILVSGMRGSQWDEFTDWLLIPRYLLEVDSFPSEEVPFLNAHLTGYPYSWHFITYIASRVTGQLVESAGPISNIILLFSFAALVGRVILIGAQKHLVSDKLSWPLTATVMLAVTLFNPTFAQKVVLTAYADTSSAVATGAAMVLAWFFLEALCNREFDRAKSLALTLGFVLALLINLKQATLSLVLIIILATIFVSVRSPKIPINRVARMLPAITIPAAIMFLTWRYHLATELSLQEVSIRPFGAWSLDLTTQILSRMLLVLSKKGVYLILVLILIGFGLRGFFRAQTPFDRFAALAAMVILGYNAFLLFAYVTAFSPFDALRAASYWRYNMHLGAILVVFVAYGAAILWNRRATAASHVQRISWLPIILILAAPFIFAHKLRFDLAPMIVHYRDVATAVANLVEPSDMVFNADPQGSGESSAVLKFALGRRATYAGQVSAFTKKRLHTLQVALDNPETTAVLIHSTNSGYEDALGTVLPHGKSYFLRRDGQVWKVVKSWDQP